MTVKRTVGVVAALLGVLVCAAVAANGAPAQANKDSAQSDQSAPPSFSELDRNHDGRLMRAEVPHDMHKLRLHFRQYDRDGNGWLSKQEYDAFAHPKIYRRLD